MADSKTVIINDDDLKRALSALADAGRAPKPLMSAIAAAMASATERNFEVEGPDWQALAEATIKRRKKKGSWPGKILQVSGALARSVTTRADDASAEIGANTKYAAIHQFGGAIEIGARTIVTRLRTDAKGNLIRQGDDGRLKNLAVFAKRKHKRVVERKTDVAGRKVDVPARPYLPANAQGELQPGVRDSILDLVQGYLSGAWGGNGKT